MLNKSDFNYLKWTDVGTYGEFPVSYSENACRIISDKYFAEGESSMWDMVVRVANAITGEGLEKGYFGVGNDCVGTNALIEADEFEFELATLLLEQRAMFNSPVFFNVGVNDPPQCSACFIQGVDDSMESILDLVKKEGMIFKHGSGTGTNFSTIRAKGAPIAGGGEASGPLDFMKLYDAGAAVIKSGGKTRRAAKMNILDCNHPDFRDFIKCKAEEEKKARKLRDAGIEDPYDMVDYQNANHTVRLSDAFMGLAISDEVLSWDGKDTAGTIMEEIAEAVWECGDPGIQFSDTINKANPLPPDGPIRASNPCGEFLWFDNSACNLASINLVKFWQPGTSGVFNYFALEEACKILITAMDIIVDMSSYPTEEIKKNSLKYRPLGLGYTNLGALLALRGVRYDSVAGRAIATTATCLMRAAAVDQSEYLGKLLGCCPGLDRRNAQLTLLAPTGTISFAMDCDSTGIEPIYSEHTTKNLTGGGTLDVLPKCFEKNQDKDVWCTAVGKYAITPEAHLEMLAAVQPHLCGGISKTINMPSTCTPDDIRELMFRAWQMDLKSLTFYRDGSKGGQPLVEHKPKTATEISIMEKMRPTVTSWPLADTAWYLEPEKVARTRMPQTRTSTTHKFNVGGMNGYFTVGLYEDGTPGELFVTASNIGSTLRGMLDTWATTFSMALQYGVPLKKLVSKFRGYTFDPSGVTTNPDIPMCTSLVDYIMQWIAERFLLNEAGNVPPSPGNATEPLSDDTYYFGEPCPDCNKQTVVTGTCKSCPSCGWNGGCG